MNDSNINYYAIIPAVIRYDLELNPNAKLLYGEITALCNQYGYCWATNEYFSELYGTSEKTISRWIKNLENKNYISTKLSTKRYEDGTVKKIRHISLDKDVLDHIDNNGLYHMDKIVQNHMDKNVPYNNTKDNNTYSNMGNNKKERNIIPPTLEMIRGYCELRNNGIDAKRFFDYYECRGWYVGKSKMKDWQSAIRLWEQNKKSEKSTDYNKSNMYFDSYSGKWIDLNDDGRQ